MIEGISPLLQTALGTLLTWGLTAAGSALVFVFHSGKRSVLDGSLGFAAGVMIAASYWSLLAPAIEMAEHSGIYGSDGKWAFIPVAVGFLLGAVFVWAADQFLPGTSDPALTLAMQSKSQIEDIDYAADGATAPSSEGSVELNMATNIFDVGIKRRHIPLEEAAVEDQEERSIIRKNDSLEHIRWRRIMLLIVAITVHNIPEGLAVGVGFGAVGKSPSATFQSARNLALGIGIQNFPEGLAVSLPLRAAGFSSLRSFWYGQLSGMVEPVAGLLGALLVSLAEPLLPYALAFAAGAMIFVVIDDVIPEAQTCGNRRTCSGFCILGFLVMMCLDVGLG